jgi:hypothetical protein
LLELQALDSRQPPAREGLEAGGSERALRQLERVDLLEVWCVRERCHARGRDRTDTQPPQTRERGRDRDRLRRIRPDDLQRLQLAAIRQCRFATARSTPRANDRNDSASRSTATLTSSICESSFAETEPAQRRDRRSIGTSRAASFASSVTFSTKPRRRLTCCR